MLTAPPLLLPSPPTARVARRLAKDPTNAKALKDFIDYALSKPDVYFITYSDLIYWMQASSRACGAAGARRPTGWH